VREVREHYGFSERRVCRALGQPRSTQRYIPQPRDDEAPLTRDIVSLACQYGRYGYRRITGKLWEHGWSVSFSRVERIWKREGLKVPQKQPKRARCGSPTAPVCGCARAGPTRFGPTILSRTARMTAGRSGSSR